MRAILVDDEVHCTKLLEWQLEKYCPSIEVIGTYNDPRSALRALEVANPDVVFLDIEMPAINGFEILEKLDQISFRVIFTTAYDHYAIQAIKISALDYLLKPISIPDLVTAVNRLLNTEDDSRQSRLDILKTQLEDPKKEIERLAVPTSTGYVFITVDSIMFCEASSNYTIIHFADRSKLVVSRTLKQTEEVLSGNNFVRVHQTYLVHLKFVSRYVKGSGGYLVLNDNSMINVANSKKKQLIEKLNTY